MAHNDHIIVNSAHAESRYTCLAFSRDGSKIYTGGAEGYVRIWRTDLGDTQEPDVATEGQDGINSISTSPECWLSGSSDTCVRVYDAEKSTMRGLVTRTVAVPVRCVALDPKGQRVAVASDELEIKIIDLASTTNIQKLEGHQKGVRKVTWHPSGTILTSSGCDGEVIVWDIPGIGESQRVKTISGFLPTTDPDSEEYVYDCSCVWHPSGQYFFIATRAHEIVTVSKDTWQKSLTFSNDAVTGAVTALAVSSNGVYLASATISGVFIWSTMTRKILFQYTPEMSFSIATHLAFSPTENLLAWTDADANLIRWSKPVSSSFPDPVKSNSSIATLQKPITLDKTDMLKPVSHPTHQVTGEKQVDDYEMDDDWMIDDIGLLDHPDKEPNLEQPYTKEMVSVTKAQSAFQPSSTPMINKKRYLAYNMIGVIEITDQDTHNVVNIEFHDRSTRISSHFQDYNKCHMASLGERGALYACPEEGEHSAQIMYKPYSAWGSSGEWDYSLPTGEIVLALAAGGSSPSKSLRRKSSDGDVEGNGNVIVATSRGYIRFFSGGGVQRYVWNLAVDVVSMTAGREWVFIVHRDGGTSLDGCQNLSYSLVGFDTYNIVQTGRLPMPRGATLKWIGISEEGAPAMYDSNGLLSILDRFRRPTQARWIPLLDTTSLARRQGKDESYWPIGVSGSLFMCIILKGKEEYPGFPRPLIQELEVQMPIYSLDEPSGRAEEKIIREKVHIDFIQDGLGPDAIDEDISRRILNLDKELIQLIQLACKNDKLQRALDLVTLLHNTSSFDLAMRVADFYHLPGLKGKLQSMKQERVRKDNVDDTYEEETFSKDLAPIPAPRKARTYYAKPHSESFTTSTTVRSSLAPAIPVAPSSTSFGAVCADTSSIPFDTLDTSDSLPYVWDTPIDETQETDKKRKDFEASESQDQSASKRRLLSTTEPISNKAASNPFAKKNRNNPFAQSGLISHETTRSNSFFDKIDDSQNKNASMKAKQKNSSRQTTLYGLPSGSSMEKKSRPKTKHKDTATTTNDVQTSVTMSSAQPVDELQVSMKEDTAPASPIINPDDEIEWPESPPRIPKGLDINLAAN